MSDVKRLKMEKEDELKGNFLVAWRNEVRVPAKVIDFIDDSDGRRMVYELIGGQEKGARFTSRFSPNQEVDIYDEDSVILAALT